MNDPSTKSVGRPVVWFGPVLFILSLLIYYFALSRGPYPGESASLIAQFAGLDPIRPLGNTLWGWLVRLVAQFPGALAFHVNLLSAVCGAGAVWAMYALVSRIPHNRTVEESRATSRPAALQTISGVAAALLLAFSAPFIFVSTRAHYLSFNALLMLVLMLIFLRFMNTRKASTLYLFSFLYGLGVVEYPVLVLFAPLCLLIAIIALSQGRILNVATLGKGALFFFLGFLLFPLAALEFRFHPAFHWFEMTYYHEALVAVAQYKYHVLMRGVARTGWLIILFCAVLPWFIVFIPKHVSREKGARWGSYLLHAVLAALALIVFFRMDVSPMRYVETMQALIAPYILIAMWGGYVAGYGCATLCRADRLRQGRTRRKAGLSMREWAYAVVVLAVLAAGSVANRVATDTRSEIQVNRIASTVLDEMGDRTWLITGGVLEPHLKILAHDRGMPLTILNQANARSRAYMKYVETLFDEPRYQSLAEIGMTALISGWLTEDPDVHEKVAVLDAPDVWVGADYVPLPKKALYLGVRDLSGVNLDSLFAEHVRFWQTIADADAIEEAFARAVFEASIRHVGKVANDLGVLLDDEGRTDQAYAAYEWAREIDPENISALLNMVAVAHREDRPELAELEHKVEQLSVRREERPSMWMLSSMYGYVRNPAVHFARGHAWVASGRSQAAVREMQRAAALNPERLDADLLVAAALQDQELGDVGESMLREMLERNPDNVPVVYQMLQLVLRRGDVVSARTYLERLRALTDRPRELLVEEASILAMEGNSSEALSLLQGAVQDDPAHVRAWAAKALIALSLGDPDAAEQALGAMFEQGGHQAEVLSSIAQIRARMGQHDRAQAVLERLLRINPRHRRGLEMMLVYDWAAARRDQAKERIDILLTQDPGHGLANYVLGSIQFSQSAFGLAESSFRASLRQLPSAEAHANLAWLLQHRGMYEGALEHARQAVEMDPSSSSAWHTLGLVLVRLDQLDEAETALQRALELNPENDLARVYTAYLYEARGMYRQSRDILEAVLLEDVAMLPEMAAEVRTVLTRVRQARNN